MDSCSDPECGPGSGRGCDLLHDDSGLPHAKVGIEMGRGEMRGGERPSVRGNSLVRLG